MGVCSEGAHGGEHKRQKWTKFPITQLTDQIEHRYYHLRPDLKMGFTVLGMEGTLTSTTLTYYT